MSMSLHGLVAAEGDGPERGLRVGGDVLHSWLTAGNVSPGSFRPEQGANAAVFDEMLATGAVITGRHTFEWAGGWGVMMHGASSAQALLRAGLVDELAITLVPILLGRGRRLFDEKDPVVGRMRLVRSLGGEGVLDLRYAVRPAA